MKVFVTGVGGQLGHDVMNELAKRGYEGIGSDIAQEYSGVMDGSAVTMMPYVQLDITDKEAVEKVLDELLLEENTGEYEVFCSEGKVTLKFKYAPDKSRVDWFENNMVKNSCALISLVSGLNEVAWEYPAIDKTHGFKRSEVKEFLGYEAAEFSASAKAIQVLLNRLGLNEL